MIFLNKELLQQKCLLFKNEYLEKIAKNYRLGILQNDKILNDYIIFSIYTEYGEPHSSYTIKKKMNYIFDVNKNNNYIGYKTVLGCMQNELSKYSNKFFKELKQNIKAADININHLKLRMAKTPWNYVAHFDCYNQFCFELIGDRTMLLWKGDLTPIQVSIIQPLDIKDTHKYLTKIGINSEIVIIKEGMMMYLPRNIWHKVEIKKEDPKICLLLNIVLYDEPSRSAIEKKECDNKFNTYWPVQFNNCIFNNGVCYSEN